MYTSHGPPQGYLCHMQHPPADVAIAPAPAHSAAPATAAAADSAAPAVGMAAAPTVVVAAAPAITTAAASAQHLQQAASAKAPAPAAPSSPGRSASPRSATSQAYLSQPLPPCQILSAPEPSLAAASEEWEGDSRNLLLAIVLSILHTRMRWSMIVHVALLYSLGRNQT